MKPKQHIFAFLSVTSPFILGPRLFVKVKKIRQKNKKFFLNYNLIPLDMYNGLSIVYHIKLERKNPLVYEGLKEKYNAHDT